LPSLADIVDFVIDLAFHPENKATAAAAKTAAGEEAMTITQRDRDLGTAYALREPATRTELTSVAANRSL